MKHPILPDNVPVASALPEGVRDVYHVCAATRLQPGAVRVLFSSTSGHMAEQALRNAKEYGTNACIIRVTVMDL